MFNDAQDFIIEGGTFTSVGGDFNQYNIQGNLFSGDGELGIQTLGRVVSLGAIHDSSERYPPPSCHAQTRLEVRRLISDWIEDPNTSSFILWLYGSAGVGKSAIMQSIAEQLADRPGTLGASFFFSAGKADRNQGKFLVPTIAYQLALNVPELRTHINSAMISNPALHTKTINVQIQHFIVKPFQKIAASLQIAPTVLVDGLDECEDHEIQKLIVMLIGEALATYKLPIRFVIASRPEGHIREAFDTSKMWNITHRIFLDESFQASRDIQKYLEDGFRAIHDKNLQVMADVARPWPGQGVIDLLVQKSSGQFIYAATVLKFVGTEYYRPTTQLSIVLQPRPTSVQPFADLDHLYHQILSSHNNPTTLVRVLGTLIIIRSYQPPEVIEDILGMDAGELSLVLGGLHSVINFPPSQVDSYDGDGRSDQERGLRLFHASFRDYLVDSDRSGIFFVDEEKFRVELAFLAFELLAKWISRSWREESDRPLRPRTWGYLRENLPFHFGHCLEEGRHRILDLLRSHIECLSKVDRIPQVQLAPLHCAMSFIEHVIRFNRRASPQNQWFPYRRLIHYNLADRLLGGTECSDEVDKALDQKFIEIFKILRLVLDRSYDLLLLRSSDVNDFIISVQGFIALIDALPRQDMAEILDIDVGLLETSLEQNRQFMFSRKRGSAFNWHFVDYLCDQRRSGPRYHDRRVDCIFLCIRCISLSVQGHWSQFERCRQDTQRYFNSRFVELLDAINILATDSADHPLWTLVDYLEEVVFYDPELQNAMFNPLRRIWEHTSKVLIWVQNQQQLIKDMNTTLHLNFEQKLDKIVDNICQQILYVESTHQGPTIRLCPPFLTALKPADPRQTRSRHFGTLSIPSIDRPRDDLPILSNDIRLLEPINLSLEQYLTSPTRAMREMYISKDSFHTQLAELWLNQLIEETGVSPNTVTQMSAHLLRASGSKRIFDRLGVIMIWWSQGFLAMQAKPLSRNVIIWLETLDKPPLDVYLTFQMMLLKAEEDPVRNQVDMTPSEFNPYSETDSEPEEPPVTHSTTSNSTVPLPIEKPRWKHAVEGIGDGYFLLGLFLVDYFYFLFYWRRRQLL